MVPTEPVLAQLPTVEGVIDQADDDPAWWEDVDGMFAVFTRQGQLTAAIDGSGPLRAFDDGTVISCGDGDVIQWDGASWASHPTPALPDLIGNGDHYCSELVADPTVAWSLLATGHLCRYDGAFDCADVSTTILAPPGVGPGNESLALTDDTLFAAHDHAGAFTTEIYAVERTAPAASARMIATIDSLLQGEIERIFPIPGRDEVVTKPYPYGFRQNPLVIGREGVLREIDVHGLGQDGDDNLILTTSVRTMDAGTFVIANRTYETTTCDEFDDCESTTRWSEMVVLRDRDGETVEVGHLGAVGEVLPEGYALRVDGELRIATIDGWYRLGE